MMAGCGSSDEPAATTPQPVEHGAFAHCLSEHGVTEASGAAGPMPGPAASPPGVDQKTWENAMQACATLAPGPAAP